MPEAQYVLVLWEYGLPPARALGPSSDQAALEAAGQRIASHADTTQAGFGPGVNYTVLLTEDAASAEATPAPTSGAGWPD